MKSKTIARLESKNRPEKDKQTAETEENETAMMCWENFEGSPGKEPYEKTDDKEEKPVNEMQTPKDEENMSTLHYIQATDEKSLLKNLVGKQKTMD